MYPLFLFRSAVSLMRKLCFIEERRWFDGGDHREHHQQQQSRPWHHCMLLFLPHPLVNCFSSATWMLCWSRAVLLWPRSPSRAWVLDGTRDGWSCTSGSSSSRRRTPTPNPWLFVPFTMFQLPNILFITNNLQFIRFPRFLWWEYVHWQAGEQRTWKGSSVLRCCVVWWWTDCCQVLVQFGPFEVVIYFLW